jgi:hypothetical protein
MELIWLGYDNLSVRFDDIAAVLLYRSALDRRIIRSYGRVPENIRSVVITGDGSCWPSSRHADQLRYSWARWRIGSMPGPHMR